MTGPGGDGIATPTGNDLPPRYEVRNSLGKGGMGRVFLCYDTVLDALVAIKMLAPHLMADGEAVESMRNEARAVFKFHDCPGILRLHSFDQHQGNWYLVMEYAEGGSLDARLKREGRFSEGEVRRLGAEVAEALDYAHRHHVLHRDVKPGNILLDKAGKVKVGDFGIAKLMDGASAVTMTITGTPAYMSPESILRSTMDRRTDQYSLGCMLFEMAAGRRPYVGSQGEIFQAKLTPEAKTPDPRDIAPDVSDELAGIILRTIALLPDERYPTCADLAAALREGATTVAEEGATITQSTAGPDVVTARVLPPTSRGAATVPVAAHPVAPTQAVAVPAPSAKSRLPLLLGAGGLLAAGIAAFVLSGGEKGTPQPGPVGTNVAGGDTPPKPAADGGKPAPSGNGPAPASPGGASPRSDGGAKPPAPAPADPPPKGGGTPIEKPADPGPANVPPAPPPTPPAPEKPAFVPAVADLPPPPAEVVAAQRSIPLPEGFHRDADGRIWCDADGAEMVLVRAGEFSMGSADGEPDEKPVHAVKLGAYLVDRHEVTVGQFRRFVEARGPGAATPEQPALGASDRNPVVGVDWNLAGEYARWAKKSLPTEAQWEKAARGPKGFAFPWGDADRPNRYNADGAKDGSRGLAAVGKYPDDLSPYGCFDMAGNVSEWCSDWYDAGTYGSPAAATAEDPRGPEGPGDVEMRVVRGGSWSLKPVMARAFARNRQQEGLPKPARKDTIGLRCVRTLP